jgi:alpha-ketoglutarate-dependent taurine dioxygenase
MSASLPASGPFSLDDEPAYRRWRAAKLAACPPSPDDLWVRVRDPLDVSATERAALLDRVARANLALFEWARPSPDSAVLRAFLAQLGLVRLDHNLGADDDGVTGIAVKASQQRTYIPYTNRPLSWHTDGYYNPPDRQIRAWALYCVRDAAAGGANQALDHEIAYIRLRDENPAWIAALTAPDAMTIPANEGEEGVLREAQAGPVFSVDAGDGRLHMRYSARQRNVAWRPDQLTQAAAARLLALFSAGDDYIYSFRLEPGQGVLSNNVLHRRDGFSDEPGRQRLILRARYYDRVGNTGAA